MSEKKDYSWGKERVTNSIRLGNIVTIPLEAELESEEEFRRKSEIQADVVVDEFKEKMAKMLSQELHKK
ncbi:hypothetical protein V7O66_09785 [Methanolobus sp. ZRKC3]|uniref:hypothetical protein n=1 Tax=Methanolobus sp. ZRKC3 TaxID=3125786 RepID=UPI0032442A48